ncbi:hypothetical protein HOJ01_01010 [bacterium]|jgi:hypothetical protein|nr:hypothetical protein [bacterium]MBT6293368.1 hypothetical protein [bacterium]
MQSINPKFELEHFKKQCGPVDEEGKINPGLDSITGMIQLELLRVYSSEEHPIPVDNLKHVSLSTFKEFLSLHLQKNNLQIADMFESKIIDVFLDQILEKTNLQDYLAPGYIFLIFPIPFDQNMIALTKENLNDADNLRFLLLENINSQASYTMYRGTYLHKILPSEFLDCSFKIPEFTQGQPLSNEFKEDLKSEILNSIDKLKDLLI